jgi:lipopolysaccharide/colanic/teichoic acid biosynthesis glycosyltransferase
MLNPDRILVIQDASAPAARELFSPLSLRRQLRVKFWVDRVLAFAGLIMALPLLLACAMVIKAVSPGPALFVQTRIGFQGREFSIFKLRTMDVQNGAEPNDDPRRIFWFGAVMRRFSIDELPQLLNVLRGEMSLVGPRPHMAGQKLQGVPFEEAVFHYARRHQVMPGMTGWAQINGCRGPAATHEQLARRVAHDLHYAEHWSLKFDFVILLRTFCFGFIGKRSF